MRRFPLVKSLFLLIYALLFLVTTLYLIEYEKPQNIRVFALYKAWHKPTEANISDYIEKSTSPQFISYLTETYKKDFNQPLSKDIKDVYQWLKSIQDDSSSNVLNLYLDNRIVRDPVEFKLQEKSDENIPINTIYVVEGELGYHQYSYDLFVLNKGGENSNKYLNTKYSFFPPLNETTYKGSKNINDVENELKDDFNSTLTSIKEKKTGYPVVDKDEKLENLEIKEFKFIENVKIKKDVTKFKLGDIKVLMNNCNRENSLEIEYDIEKKQIIFSKLEEFVEKLCRKQFIQMEGYLLGTCEDCTHYPADKKHGLRPDYTPQVSAIGFASGGQFINVAAYEDFYQMYTAAKNAGYIIHVTSGYRSYATQQATYENWVRYEMSLGKSRAEAEIAANTYSATPGFSEHQLGTALDLNSGGCGLTSGCNGNQGIWNWLADNAHIYGFALSYPSGKESQTGYIYEPWHYRWIGRELAKEYKQVEASTWLAKFLFEKGLY